MEEKNLIKTCIESVESTQYVEPVESTQPTESVSNNLGQAKKVGFTSAPLFAQVHLLAFITQDHHWNPHA